MYLEVIIFILGIVLIFLLLIPRKQVVVKVFPSFEEYNLDSFLEFCGFEKNEKKIYSRYIEWCEEKREWCLPFKVFNQKLRLSMQQREKNKILETNLNKSQIRSGFEQGQNGIDNNPQKKFESNH
jgi:hypothetical protein